MRAPYRNPRDWHFGPTNRYAGTQGYRHQGATHVAWVDGHAAAHPDRFVTGHPLDEANIAEDTGFLSRDNSLYDLE
jgi:prepilin-type processing-associated H-X9-DG protein